MFWSPKHLDVWQKKRAGKTSSCHLLAQPNEDLLIFFHRLWVPAPNCSMRVSNPSLPTRQKLLEILGEGGGWGWGGSRPPVVGSFLVKTLQRGCSSNMNVSKNRGKTPKMDGWIHGKPYEQTDDLGGKHPYFWKHLYCVGMGVWFKCVTCGQERCCKDEFRWCEFASCRMKLSVMVTQVLG